MQQLKEQMQKQGRKKWHEMPGTLRPHLTPEGTTFLTGLQMDGLVLRQAFSCGMSLGGGRMCLLYFI